jgi:glucose-1-phosphate thymidylyltransferase
VLDRIGVDDDLLVVAGDNLFDYSLAEYADWWRGKGVASAVAVYDVGDRQLIKQYGVVALDDDERVIDFVEKPSDPPSTLAATATYLYHREHLTLVEGYLAEGNPPDQPGNLVAWLHKRVPVYGYTFTGGWYDIGTPEQLLEADNRLRARSGLPTRTVYAPD